MSNEKMNETIIKLFGYIDWYRDYDQAADDKARKKLINSVPTTLSTLLIENKLKVETLFSESIDQPVYMTDDYLRLRKFMVYWYSAFNTIIKEELNTSDINFIDKPLLLDSLGYDLWYKHSEANQITLSTELSDMFAKKGTPLVLSQAMSMLDISNFMIFEYWLTRGSGDGELQFTPVQVEDMSYFTGYFTAANPPKSFSGVTESDPHWYLTEDEIVEAESRGDIGLPSMTPYVGVVSANDWIRNMQMGMAWIQRLISDQLEAFRTDPTSLEESQKYYFTALYKNVSLLELYLATGFIYNEMYGRTSDQYARGSVIDLTNSNPSRYSVWPSIHQFSETDLFAYIKDSNGTLKLVPYTIDPVKLTVTFYTEEVIDGEMFIVGEDQNYTPSNIYKLDFEESNWVQVGQNYALTFTPHLYDFQIGKFLVFLRDNENRYRFDYSFNLNPVNDMMTITTTQPFSGRVNIIGQLTPDSYNNFFNKNVLTTDAVWNGSKQTYFISSNEHNFIGDVIAQAYDNFGNLLDVTVKDSDVNYKYEKKLEYDIDIEHPPIAIKVSEDASKIAVIHNGGQYLTTYRWRNDKNKFYRNTYQNVNPPGVPIDLAISDDGNFLAVIHNGGQFMTTYRWDTYLLRYSKTADLDLGDVPASLPIDIAMSYDGSRITIVYDSNLKVATYKWMNEADQYIKTDDISYMEMITGSPKKIAMTSDGSKLVICDDSANKINTYLWSDSLGRYQLGTFINTGDAPQGLVVDISISADGNKLAIATNDGDKLYTYSWDGTKYIKDNRYNVNFLVNLSSCSLSNDGKFLNIGLFGDTNLCTYVWNDTNHRYEKTFLQDINPDLIFSLDSALNGKLMVTIDNTDQRLSLYRQNTSSNITIETDVPFNGKITLFSAVTENPALKIISGQLRNMSLVPKYNGPEGVLYSQIQYVTEYNKVHKRTFDRDTKDSYMKSIASDWSTTNQMLTWTHPESAILLEEVNPQLKALCIASVLNGTAYDLLVDMLKIIDFYVRHDLGLTSFSSLFMLYDPVQDQKDTIEEVFNFFKPYQTRLIDIKSYILLKDIPGDCMAAKEELKFMLKNLFVDYCICYKDQANIKMQIDFYDRIFFNKLKNPSDKFIGHTIFTRLMDGLSPREKLIDKYQDIKDSFKMSIRNFFVEWTRFKDSSKMDITINTHDHMTFNQDLRSGVRSYMVMTNTIEEVIKHARYNPYDSFQIIVSDIGVYYEPDAWTPKDDKFEIVVDSSVHKYKTSNLLVFALDSNFNIVDISYSIDPDTLDVTVLSNIPALMSVVIISHEQGYKLFKKTITEESWTREGSHYYLDILPSEHGIPGQDIYTHLKDLRGTTNFVISINIDNTGKVRLITNDKIEIEALLFGKDPLNDLGKTYGRDFVESDWSYNGDKYYITVDLSEHGYTNSVIFPFMRDSNMEIIDVGISITSLRKDNVVTFYSSERTSGRLNIFNFTNLPWI